MIDLAKILARLEDLPLIRQRVSSPRFLIYAVLIHVLFLSLFLASFDWTPEPTPSRAKMNIIAAVVVDEARVQAEIDKLKKAEKLRKKQDDARQHKVKKEEQKLAELKKKKIIEQKRLQEQKKKRLAEEKKTLALSAKKKSELAKLNEIKKEQAKLEKKQKAEKKRLAELKKKRKAEIKRQEKLKQKKKAEQQRKEAEQALQKQLAIEQQVLADEQLRQSNRVVDRYVAIIKQKVTRNWLRPSGARKGLSCVVAVKLIPGGEVLSARVIKSSGDPVFDRSVESAVLKASPLPLPPGGSLFERFREMNFVFNPEG